MVKASVGKENRQRLNLTKENLDRYTPILGNLRTFEFDDRQPQPSTGQASPQAAQGYQGPDMPEEFDGAW